LHRRKDRHQLYGLAGSPTTTNGAQYLGSPSGTLRVVDHRHQLRRRRYGALTFVAALTGFGLCCSAALSQVAAPNEMHFPARTNIPNSPSVPPNTPMLVQADEIKYDYPNDTISAVSHVQIYYGESIIEANQVIFDQKNKRLRAEGDVRLTEPNGILVLGALILLNVSANSFW
jgi:LPS-assembly protein